MTPAPNIYVANLTADGVIIAIYFWIATNESKPLEVFDVLATDIKTVLYDLKVELYPPNTIALQTSKGNHDDDGENSKNRSEFFKNPRTKMVQNIVLK